MMPRCETSIRNSQSSPKSVAAKANAGPQKQDKGPAAAKVKAGAEGPAKQDKGAAAAKPKAKPQGDKTSATAK